MERHEDDYNNPFYQRAKKISPAGKHEESVRQKWVDGSVEERKDVTIKIRGRLPIHLKNFPVTIVPAAQLYLESTKVYGNGGSFGIGQKSSKSRSK